ncbi:MAG: DUF503 domain-containing protein [candidate division Zixibacteria bacterium]|nr:DUF503 domain-containing protein [candidate division Zixibacteria bacterium]
MIIGTVVIELNLPGVNSLKEKRRRIKSLLTRVRNKFNVSASEVDYNDSHRRACLGVAVVSNDKQFSDQVISKVINMIENENEMYICDYQIEII